MGNVVSVLVARWPGVFPSGLHPATLIKWGLAWTAFVARLAFASAAWGFGLTTVHLPPFPSLFGGKGKGVTARAAAYAVRLVAWMLAFARHVVSPDLVMRQLLAVVVLQSGCVTRCVVLGGLAHAFLCMGVRAGVD